MTNPSVDPRELADDLRALLERLEITAAVMDESGHALSETHGAQVLRQDADAARRLASVRMRGHAFTVTMLEDSPCAALRPLTARQRSVCELVAAGLKNREIAERLGISLHTVRRHVEAMLARLRVANRHEAARALQAILEKESDSAEASSGPRRVA